MRWKAPQPDRWRKAFALFPVKMDDGTMVWLERFEYRLSGIASNRHFVAERRAVA
jgi:hypothetical protein